MGRGTVCIALVLAAASVGAPAAFGAKKPAKDKNPPSDVSSGADASKADLNATLQLANIKVSRLALAQDPGLADVKDTLGPIYDRQEWATKDGVSKLHSASGDKAKQADAVRAIAAADDEAAQYFRDNPAVKEKLAKRSAIINAEVGQISKSPDGYVAALQKAGVKSPALDQARTLVKDASAKAAAAKPANAASPVLDAQGKVRALLTAEQNKALDGQFAK